MFQFSPLASTRLCIQRGMTAHDGCRVSPFGHLRISAYVRLPEAFRSLSRPSSPVRAKASTVRPFPLDRICFRAHTPQGYPQSPWTTHSGPPPKVLFLSLCYSLFPSPGLSINSSFGGGANTMCARLASAFLPRRTYSASLKGGDPAAGSPTATLLRLRPSHRARLRPLSPRRVESRTSGAPDSHGVTGGVYKARERIHRGVADPRLLAIPASCSRVTDCNPNLDQVSPIRSTSRSCNGLSWPL